MREMKCRRCGANEREVFMTDELKPCPFCGSMNIRKPIGEDGWMCKTCGSKGFVDWNTRPIEDDLRKRIAELEGLVRELLAEGTYLSLLNGLVDNDSNWKQLVDKANETLTEVQE